MSKSLAAGQTPKGASVGDEDTVRFLDALGGRITFQTIDDRTPKRQELAQVVHGSWAQNEDRLSNLNAQHAGIFAMVNEGDGKGRSASNVRRVRAYFVDFDGVTPPDPATVPLPPHCVVESSPGRWHWYWWVKDAPLDTFTSVQRALAERFGSDRTVIDLPRVMRLPGSWHCKGEPFRVRIASLSDAPRYGYAEFAKAFGIEPSAAPERRHAEPDKVLTGRAAQWATNRARRYLQDEAPIAVQGAGGDATTYEVACCIREFGVTQDEALELMAENWNERCQPSWALDELTKKVANAYEYATSALGSDNPATIFTAVAAADKPIPAIANTAAKTETRFRIVPAGALL